MINSCWYTQKQHGILVLCPIQAHYAPLKQLHVAGGVRPPGSCLMLHTIANMHRFAGLSIDVPIVIAWTLDSVHSN